MDVINHTEQALDRLPSFLSDATLLRAMMSAVLVPAAAFEASLQSMTLRSIELAQGSQLDDIGALVLFPRSGRDDNTYRLWLRARLFALRTAGRADEIIKLVRLLNPSAVSVDVFSLAPSTAITEVQALTTDPVTLREILKTVVGAGIRLDLVWTLPGEDALIFGDTAEAVPDAHGIGDATDSSVGGVLASTI